MTRSRYGKYSWVFPRNIPILLKTNSQAIDSETVSSLVGSWNSALTHDSRLGCLIRNHSVFLGVSPFFSYCGILWSSCHYQEWLCHPQKIRAVICSSEAYGHSIIFVCFRVLFLFLMTLYVVREIYQSQMQICVISLPSLLHFSLFNWF